jgi:hypothetical protein
LRVRNYDIILHINRAFETKSESTDGLGSPTRVDEANKMAEIFERIEKDVAATLPALGLFQVRQEWFIGVKATDIVTLLTVLPF